MTFLQNSSNNFFLLSMTVEENIFFSRMAVVRIFIEGGRFCVSLIIMLYIIVVSLMPLAETILELVTFILEGVDLIDHTSLYLLRTINRCVILITCILS